ncbi:MAG: M56 family metallopeptidase [Clostridia bacterium]|nr:M56 family metallopeptidase [Clostridia bacterium]
MGNLFLQYLGISALVSICALALLLVERLVGRRFSARCGYLLWLVLAFRLLLPLGLTELLPASADSGSYAPIRVELPASVQVTRSEPAAPPIGTEPTEAESIETEPVETSAPTETTPIETPSAEPVRRSLSIDTDDLLNIAAAAWLTGAAGFLIWRFGGYALWAAKLKPRATDDRLKSLYARFCAAQSVKRPPRLFVSDATASPMLCGLIRPRLILPAYAAEMSDSTLTVVLAHELCHHRRHDLFWKTLITLAQGLHWYNPLVHLAASRAQETCELSCDEMVLAGMSGEVRGSYGQALLAMIKRAKSPRAPASLTTHFNPRKNAVKARFAWILDGSKKRSGRILIVSIVLICLSLGTVFACSVGQKRTFIDTGDAILTADGRMLLKYTGDGDSYAIPEGVLYIAPDAIPDDVSVTCDHELRFSEIEGLPGSLGDGEIDGDCLFTSVPRNPVEHWPEDEDAYLAASLLETGANVHFVQISDSAGALVLQSWLVRTEVYMTSDGGISWVKTDDPARPAMAMHNYLEIVAFADETTGMLTFHSFADPPDTPLIQFTSDGKTWRWLELTVPERLYDEGTAYVQSLWREEDGRLCLSMTCANYTSLTWVSEDDGATWTVGEASRVWKDAQLTVTESDGTVTLHDDQKDIDIVLRDEDTLAALLGALDTAGYAAEHLADGALSVDYELRNELNFRVTYTLTTEDAYLSAYRIYGLGDWNRGDYFSDFHVSEIDYPGIDDPVSVDDIADFAKLGWKDYGENTVYRGLCAFLTNDVSALEELIGVEEGTYAEWESMEFGGYRILRTNMREQYLSSLTLEVEITKSGVTLVPPGSYSIILGTGMNGLALDFGFGSKPVTEAGKWAYQFAACYGGSTYPESFTLNGTGRYDGSIDVVQHNALDFFGWLSRQGYCDEVTTGKQFAEYCQRYFGQAVTNGLAKQSTINHDGHGGSYIYSSVLSEEESDGKYYVTVRFFTDESCTMEARTTRYTLTPLSGGGFCIDSWTIVSNMRRGLGGYAL